jgi:hypothetical protein
MAALRHLAAIRTRLLAIPGIVAIVGSEVYVQHIFDIAEATYPCITLMQASGAHGVWAPRLLDGAQVQIDCFAKGDAGQMQVINLYDLTVDALHTQKTATSTVDACFHEIREVFAAVPFWDAQTNAWRASMRYLVRVSTH